MTPNSSNPQKAHLERGLSRFARREARRHAFCRLLAAGFSLAIASLSWRLLTLTGSIGGSVFNQRGTILLATTLAIGALCWVLEALFKRRTLLQVATEVDRRAALDDRLRSALELEDPPVDPEQPKVHPHQAKSFGFFELLCQRATSAIDAIDPAEVFPYPNTARAGFAGLAIASAIGLWVLLPPSADPGPVMAQLPLGQALGPPPEAGTDAMFDPEETLELDPDAALVESDPRNAGKPLTGDLETTPPGEASEPSEGGQGAPDDRLLEEVQKALEEGRKAENQETDAGEPGAAGEEAAGEDSEASQQSDAPGQEQAGAQSDEGGEGQKLEGASEEADADAPRTGMASLEGAPSDENSQSETEQGAGSGEGTGPQAGEAAVFGEIAEMPLYPEMSLEEALLESEMGGGRPLDEPPRELPSVAQEAESRRRTGLRQAETIAGGGALASPVPLARRGVLSRTYPEDPPDPEEAGTEAPGPDEPDTKGPDASARGTDSGDEAASGNATGGHQAR